MTNISSPHSSAVTSQYPYPFDPTVPFDALKVPGFRTFRAVGTIVWGAWVTLWLVGWLDRRGVDFWG